MSFSKGIELGMGGYRPLGVPPWVVEGSRVVSVPRDIPPNEIWGRRSHGPLPVQVWLDKNAIALLDDLCTERGDERAIVIGKALNAFQNFYLRELSR